MPRGRPKKIKPLAAPVATTSEPEYLVTLKVNGIEVTASDKDLMDAIKKIHVETFKTMGVLKVERDGKKAERLLPIWKMKHLFNPLQSFSSDIHRTIQLKYFQLFFR